MIAIEYQYFQKLFYDLLITCFVSSFLGFFFAFFLWRLWNWVLLKIDSFVMKLHAKRDISKTGSS